MISVIVPIYKVEQYLPRCLDSILAQTYPDLDIILVDDGSPDGCGQICDQYAKKDSRIRVFHTPNQGLSGARNLGIEKALERKSKYIAFVDSDDWLEPTMYETLINTAEKTGCDVVVYGFFRNKNGVQRTCSKPEKRLGHTEAIRELILGGLPNAVWNKFWRAECFSSMRFPQGKIFEDILTVYRLLDQIHELILIPDPLYHYCIREGSISHTKDLTTAVNRWKAYKKRYDDLSSDARFIGEIDFQHKMETKLTELIIDIWLQYKISREQLHLYAAEFAEMNAFAKNKFPLFQWRKHDLKWNLFIFLARIHYMIPIRLAAFYRTVFQFFRYAKSKLHRKDSVS